MSVYASEKVPASYSVGLALVGSSSDEVVVWSIIGCMLFVAVVFVIVFVYRVRHFHRTRYVTCEHRYAPLCTHRADSTRVEAHVLGRWNGQRDGAASAGGL